ncbi:MAG: ABC transporter ATP-binding protein [Thermodesulfobacteriota bacterium]
MFEAKSITVHYGKIQALKGISIRVAEGAIVTLIGANGAGKSSTLMAISGLRPLTSGEIWFNGERIDGMPPYKIVKKGIAQVPEARRLFPGMTVLENLEMGAYLRKDRNEIKRDLEEVFKDFPVLKEKRKQRAGTLSGGEQQMLAVARALMTRPKLLLMDEPTVGLSPLMVRGVSRIIRRIYQTGIRVLLVEQNARMALKLAQYGYVLESGKIAIEGDSEALMRNSDVERVYLGK